MALFRRGDQAPDVPSRAPEHAPLPGAKKDRPTPTRKEAEAARRQRFGQNLSKRDSRAAASRQARAERMRATAARDNTPEKQLMRDYVDARRNIGEFLLPSLVVILATSFLAQIWPVATGVTTVVMYVFIVVVLIDLFLLWRGFKRVLATRLPNASTRGLMMYGTNRAIQIRRFRIPAPRVKRGERY